MRPVASPHRAHLVSTGLTVASGTRQLCPSPFLPVLRGAGGQLERPSPALQGVGGSGATLGCRCRRASQEHNGGPPAIRGRTGTQWAGASDRALGTLRPSEKGRQLRGRDLLEGLWGQPDS